MPITVPTYDRLMNPLLKALVQLGGSASVDEMYEEVIEQEAFSDELLSILQNPQKSSQTKIAYRLAWARTYLKKSRLPRKLSTRCMGAHRKRTGKS